jgi:hypothetical protein
MSELLDNRVRALQAVLEECFLFRKLGLCYDYGTTPEDFPRKTLPVSEETRKGLPNRAGCYTGVNRCAENNALLFDGYLLRVECGFAAENDERILDRLIGGLIRTATTGPKGFLIRGLSPDGRGFYPTSSVDAHLLWAFSLWRGATTAAIQPESQGKMQNIAAKWINRIEQDAFRITPTDDGPSPDGALDAADAEAGPKLLALLAVAGAVTGEAKWTERLAAFAEADGGARLAPPPEEVTDPLRILRLQIAWHLLHHLDPDDARRAEAPSRMAVLARRAATHLGAFRRLDPAVLEETPALDWRAAFGTDERQDDAPPPPDWARVLHETETAAATAQGALALLLSPETELVEAYADEMAAGLLETPWERLLLADAVAPVVAVHGRGVERGLWDEELLHRGSLAESLLPSATVYLAEDYDEAHPERAGHTEAPPKRRPSDEPGGKSSSRRSSRRRRRRRKRR